VVQSKYYEWTFLLARFDDNFQLMNVMTVVNATALACVAAAALTLAAEQAPDTPNPPKGAKAKTAFTGKLPALDAQHLTATVLEVTHAPGGSSTAHRHPCPVIGYVLEGAVRMQVKGQEEKVYRPGDTFFESPGDVHAVSANVSQDQPARFLAFFVCDRETPLTVPVTDAKDASAR
jgi:quercetin dioxygenase-like cupin family protein